MHGGWKHSIAAVAVLGLAPGIALAAPGDNPLSGPLDAIAKAHAAADKAEQRATKHDGQAATAFDEATAPKAENEGARKGAPTAGSGGEAAAPQDPAADVANGSDE